MNTDCAFPEPVWDPGIPRLSRRALSVKESVAAGPRPRSALLRRGRARGARHRPGPAAAGDRHLRAEDALLHTSPPHSANWYPLTEGSTIDLEQLPAEQVVPAVLERLARLPGTDRLHCGGN